MTFDWTNFVLRPETTEEGLSLRRTHDFLEGLQFVLVWVGIVLWFYMAKRQWK